MNGTVCVITGATSGLGAAIAEALARLGATVVGVGRDPQRCAAAAAALRSNAGHDAVEFLAADLSSQAEVRGLARTIDARYGRISVLVNNAGAIFLRRHLSADGMEMTLALNHLAPFVLTAELRSALEAGAPARVVNVSSCGHWNARGIRFEDPQFERGYRGFRAYFHSKLANLLFTYELARRIEGSGITVNAYDPGMVTTNIGRNNGWTWNVAKAIYDRLLRPRYVTPAEAARGTVRLVTARELEGVTGQYFVGEEPMLSAPVSRDAEAGARLWALTESLVAAPPHAAVAASRPDHGHAGARPVWGAPS